MKSLELKNIEAKYGHYKVLNNISFNVNKGNIITILGGMATGKSTLAKVLCGRIKHKGGIYINGVEIVKENEYLIDRFIGCVDTYLDDKRKVVDVLFEALNNDIDEEEEIINKYISLFNIDCIDKKLDELSYDYYFYIQVISNLIKGIDYLVLDDILCYLNDDMIDTIIKYAKDNEISIINITSNIDEILLSSYSYFLYEGKIAMEGETLSCLREEKLLKRLGFNLPFMVDLSTQLMYYDILDKVYLDEKEMVDAIWN